MKPLENTSSRSPRIRVTCSAPSASRPTVISSPQPASQSGHVRSAMRVGCTVSPIVIDQGSRATGRIRHDPARRSRATAPRHGMMGAVLRRIHPEPAAARHDPRGVRRRPNPAATAVRGSSCAWWPVSTARPSSTGVARPSNPNDSEVFLTLRDLADVIVVGAGTARAEGYGPPRKAGQRVGVVSNSGRVDAELGAVLQWRRLPDRARVGCPTTTVDTVRAGTTQRRPRPRRLGVERGGRRRSRSSTPRAARTSTAPSPRADLIDELNLTLSPLLAGGDGPRLSVGGSDVWSAFDLAHLVVDEDVVRVQPVGAAPSLLSSSISRWKSAATSKSLYTDWRTAGRSTSSIVRNRSSTATPIWALVPRHRRGASRPRRPRELSMRSSSTARPFDARRRPWRDLGPVERLGASRRTSRRRAAPRRRARTW